MIKRFFRNIVGLCMIVCLLIGCNQRDRSIKTNNIDVEFDVFRFDEFLTSDEFTPQNLIELQDQYPEFFSAFQQAVLKPSEQSLFESLTAFKNYFDTTEVNQRIANNYSNINDITSQFEILQQRIVATNDTFKPIGLITINSGFNYKNFLLEDEIVVGLDMYLGDEVDYELFGPQFPNYKLHTFQKEYILPDIAETLITDLYPDKAEYNSLLSKMLYNGKKLAYKELLLPKTPSHKIIGMTEQDYNWCVENEQNIWRYLIINELLYSTDFNRFKTYVNDGPFSSGMPQDAPANTATYIGWQIAKQYLKQQSNRSIQEMMESKDAQKILNESSYKP